MVKNIQNLLNHRIFFAKNYIKINPGFYKFRDIYSISLRIYLKFIKKENKYIIKKIIKIVN